MEFVARASDNFDSFVVCDGFALENLTLVYLEEDASMFIEACVIKMKSSKVADVISDAVKDVKFESAYVGEAIEPQIADC